MTIGLSVRPLDPGGGFQ